MESGLKEYYKEREEEMLKDFFTFLHFQSISTDESHRPQVKACADWLTHYIQAMGFEVEQWPTPGNPVVFAQNLEAGPDKPTLLIYNHYDVQPVDPLHLWESPPFHPTLRNGEIYARGAQDNKGQCFYTLQALKALRHGGKKLPINIKLCIEGEEESGSVNLQEVVKDPARQKQLKADYLAIVDMGIPDAATPAVTLGVRGLVTMQVKMKGSNVDLHSGSHGGIVYNPLHALVETLATLRDPGGKITIPGFYDGIEELDAKQKAKLSLEFDEKDYLQKFGAHATGGEKGVSPLERAWNRPTLEINGIIGGYGGEGFKTVIPAQAIAKISCRLVSGQDPKKIADLVGSHIKKIAPKGIEVSVDVYPGGGRAIRANPDSPLVHAFKEAYEELFGTPCKVIFDGGTIPIITDLAKASGSEVILLGFGLPDDWIHAPNEHFGLDRMQKGFTVVARAIELLAGK